MFASSHTGKIGRLSKARRDEIGHRIQDGQSGIEIVQWLNQQPDVQTILNEHFGGRPINEQNFSDWKQGGHLEWLWSQETQGAAQRLLEHSDELDDAIRNHSLTERFAAVMTAEITRLAVLLLENEADPEKRWQRVCDINRQLSMLRRDEHRLMAITLKQRQWLTRSRSGHATDPSPGIVSEAGSPRRSFSGGGIKPNQPSTSP